MTWPGKADCFGHSAARYALCCPSVRRAFNFDETENLIIEGDNLEVLKLLQKSLSEQGQDDLH